MFVVMVLVLVLVLLLLLHMVMCVLIVCSCSCSCSCSLCLLFLCLFSSPSTWLLLMSSSDASSAALPGLQMMKASALPSSPMEISWTLRYGGVSGLLLLLLVGAHINPLLFSHAFSAPRSELGPLILLLPHLGASLLLFPYLFIFLLLQVPIVIL